MALIYEINMDESYKHIENIDEWGCAYMWDGKDGLEYNYCTEGKINSCAIYPMYEDDNGEWHTDTSRWVHYEIDWSDPNWRESLIKNMIGILQGWSKDTLKLTSDGYKYVSKNGIAYDILEGMSVGIYPKKTSDILFIMLNNADYNVDNHVVGYLFGAMLIPGREKEYEESIRQLVDEYEKRNGLGE